MTYSNKMKQTDGNHDNSTTPTGLDSSVDPAKSPNSSSKHKPRLGAPPDGGWGWVVAFSSFSISLLVDGVCFSFGIFFEDFREEFGTTKATTSWIGSVLNGSYMLVGPIVSVLVNIYGCRRVAMCGSILACVAFFLSSYSKNVAVLIFTFGFLGGIGFGLMYLPAIVIVGYYFERRRALATGIACCGSGIGAFLFAPFTEYLLNAYGWRGATWIISGLVLNGFMFALFYRPLPGPLDEDIVMETTTASKSDSLMIESEGMDNTEHEMVSLVPSPLAASEGESRKAAMKGTKNTPRQTLSDTAALKGKLSAPARNIYRCRSMEFCGPGTTTKGDYSPLRADVVRMAKSHDQIPVNQYLQTKKKASEQKRLELPALQRKDIFYSGSLWHLKEYQDVGSLEEFRQEMISGAPSAMSNAEVTKTPSGQSHSRDSDMSIHKTATVRPSVKEALTSIFDVSLLKSPTFLVYGLGCCLCMLGFFVPFIYMPVHSMGMGQDPQSAAFLISIIGITNTVGRVAVGFISDQPWADCLLINNFALMIGGAVTMFVPFFTSYYVLAIYAAIFGTSIAVFVSLRSIIMVELMGLEKLTTAFGFVIMFQGISSFLGAPAAGALSDYTGNYDASFYMAGLTLFLSGVICCPLRRIARWENGRKRPTKKRAKKASKNTTTATTSNTNNTKTNNTHNNNDNNNDNNNNNNIGNTKNNERDNDAHSNDDGKSMGNKRVNAHNMFKETTTTNGKTNGSDKGMNNKVGSGMTDDARMPQIVITLDGSEARLQEEVLESTSLLN